MCDICILVYVKFNYSVKFAKLIVNIRPICLIALPPVSSCENAVSSVWRDDWEHQNHSGQLW